MLLSEGVPVRHECVSDFARILCLKENRLIFTDEQLRILFSAKSWTDIHSYRISIPHQSIKRWVSSAIPDRELAEKVYCEHLETSDEYKKYANLVEEDDDIFVDMPFCYVEATKWK